MAKTLISASGTGSESNCGYSGVVPSEEEWYVVRVDNAWGAQGEFIVGVAGDTVNVTQCHVAGAYIGYANGQAFHYMKKYSVSARFDCINGECINSDTYDTPGNYASLEECQAQCGIGAICDGVCVSNADWSKIESLSGQLKQRNCA